MKKFVSMFAFMAAIVLGAFTFASCGDDEEDPSPSESKGKYYDFYARVVINHDENVNPFLSDADAEKKVIENLKNIMYQELLKIDGIEKTDGTYRYDNNRRSEIYSAINSAMTKLESTMQGQKLYLDGKINCAVLASSGMEKIWEKEFNYTQPSSHFTDNGIDYFVISDSEAGVVDKKTSKFNSKSQYTGDIVIPETVVNSGKTYTITAIGPQAFYGSTITSISLPKTITTLYNDCFGFTTELKSITLPGKVKNYKTYEDVTSDWSVTKEMKILHKSGITELVLEEGITDLYDDMFYEIDNLKKVVLPSTVTKIPKSCFNSCPALAEITVNGAITSVADFAFSKTGISDLSGFKFKNATLGENAFSACLNLANINIPDGVSSIGKRCFSNCKAATSVTIPASVTSMNCLVFSSDSLLTTIHVKSDKPATLEEANTTSSTVDAFSSLDFAAQGITIYVPSASVDAYKSAPVWSKYADYIKGEE